MSDKTDSGPAGIWRSGSAFTVSSDKALYLTPLFLTALPLIRVAFRHKPVLRDRLFFGAVGLGLCHGVWLIGRTSKEEEPEQFMTAPPKQRKE